MGQMISVSSSLALDCVITNAIILDATFGVVKANIRIKGNCIHNISKAGNHCRRETHHHCRGGRHPHSLLLSPAMRRGHRQQHHHAVRGRHWTQRWDIGHDLHPWPFPRRNDAAGHG
mmetsp:Transcript_1231/g.2687  ORF Transcript_1231/g.2687 Transcript_1231/m.2687 type:complete len:117 (-) Transcript_1231:46-396(-)